MLPCVLLSLPLLSRIYPSCVYYLLVHSPVCKNNRQGYLSPLKIIEFNSGNLGVDGAGVLPWVVGLPDAFLGFT